MQLSIIIPSYRDKEAVDTLCKQLLEQTAKQKTYAKSIEILVVESDPRTYRNLRAALPPFIHVLLSKKGRAKQLNVGAAASKGNLLWFIHADSVLSDSAIASLLTHACSALKNKDLWGAFSIKFTSKRIYFRLVHVTSNLRARLLKHPFGDQALFVSRSLFKQVHGFDEEQPFEDLHFSRKLKKTKAPFLFLSDVVFSSPRRFIKHGIIYTHFIMGGIYLSMLFRCQRLARKLYSLIR